MTTTSMFSSKNSREATCALYDKLRDGAPFRVVPTALFDPRGVLVDWVETSMMKARRARFAGPHTRVQRRRRHEINLLTLLSCWEARGKREELLDDRVCVDASRERPACLDAAQFRRWVRQRAWQEAEVRADTYDPSHAGYVAGPFYAQAFCLSDDGNQYEVDFSRHPRTQVPSYVCRACKRSTTMTPADSRDRKANLSATGSDRTASAGRGDGADEEDDDFFPEIDAGTAAALRNAVDALVSYIEETHEVCVHMLSVSFFRGAGHHELVLVAASNVVWDSMSPLSPRQKPPTTTPSSREEKRSPKAHVQWSDVESKVAGRRRDRPATATECEGPRRQGTAQARHATTKLAAAEKKVTALRQKLRQRELHTQEDAMRLKKGHEALMAARADLQAARAEARAREADLRESLARQQSEMASMTEELARVRSQLSVERSLRSKAEIDLQAAQKALTALDVHHDFLRRST